MKDLLKENEELARELQLTQVLLAEAANEAAALKADRDRLDWLASNDVWFDIPDRSYQITPGAFRAGLDAAMKADAARKEAQP